MRKNKKISKKVLSLCLSMFLCINSFAAIVSDNDGSAFTTKAEFEAMKQDFANQVESYQTSIEGKIDGAIASYLAGIRTTRTVIATNYCTNAKENNAKNLGFMKWATPQTSYNRDDVIGGYSVVQSNGAGGASNSSDSKYYGYSQIANAGRQTGSYNECDYLGTSTYNSDGKYTDSKKNYISGYYWVNFPFKGVDEKTNLTDFAMQDVKRHRLYMHLVAKRDVFLNAASSTAPGARVTGTITTDYTRLTQPGGFTHASQGTNGLVSMTPICSQTHTWSDLDQHADYKGDDKTNNAFLEYNLAGTIASSTFYAIEYEYRDYYNSSDSTRWTASSKNLQIQNYRPSSTNNIASSAGSAVMYKYNTTDNASSGNGVAFKFKYNIPKVFSLNWQRITNAYYNNLFGEAYYKYYGIPITDMSETGKVTFTLKLTNSTADQFKYSIMDKRHINGTLQTTLKESYGGVQTERVLKTGTLSSKTTHTVNVAFDKKVIWDKENGDYIYLKVEPSAAGQIVTADIPGSVFIEYKTY